MDPGLLALISYIPARLVPDHFPLARERQTDGLLKITTVVPGTPEAPERRLSRCCTWMPHTKYRPPSTGLVQRMYEMMGRGYILVAETMALPPDPGRLV
jgi:hypothetical protein